MPIRDQILGAQSKSDIINDALFRHGYLMGSGHDQAEVATALADKLGIDIVSGLQHLDMDCLRVASRNIGINIPEPFYRGFPKSVRAMSANALLVDQIMHYLNTYGFGNFDGPSSHSLLEKAGVREKFDEAYDIKPIVVVSPKEGADIAKRLVTDTLTATRPASTGELALAIAVIETYGLTDTIACADTRVALAAATRRPDVLAQLRIRDILELAELLEVAKHADSDWSSYPHCPIKKLNLRNQDRKLITAALDQVLARGLSIPEKFDVFERQADWCGLLHHVHYKPACENGKAFVDAMRGMKNHSRMSTFERALAAGDVTGAAKYLARTKGQGALLRHLDHILSRSTTADEAYGVLSTLACDDPGQLIQLLEHEATASDTPRNFAFAKNGLMLTHGETTDEAAKRKSYLPQATRDIVYDVAKGLLMQACAGRLGRVYVGPGMDRIAVATSSAASNAGVGTFPRGSRIPLDGRIIRAFTYWEGVNDIDISLIGIDIDGSHHEFSWRTMYARQSDAITFSGDVTNGYHGGSEYFDIDLDKVRKRYPNMRYLVLADNVYSRTTFNQCSVRAGYMLRKKPNSGEIFEPRTVKTAFAITGNSTFAYAFAIDLVNAELIWLDMTRASHSAIAADEGASAYAFLMKWFDIVDTISLGDVATMCATELVSDIHDAEIAFIMDRDEVDPNLDIEVVTPMDTERVRALIS
jgi:hypothetical protein